MALILAVSLGSVESMALAARGNRAGGRAYSNRGNAYDYRDDSRRENRNRRDDWNRQDRRDRYWDRREYGYDRGNWYGRYDYGRYGRPYPYYPRLYAYRGLARGYGAGGYGSGGDGYSDSYSGNGSGNDTSNAPYPTAHSGGWLGVILDTTYPDRAIVAQVYRDSAADQGGIRPGDEIVSLNGHSLRSRDELTALVNARHVGDRVDLKVSYDNRIHEVTVTLGARLAD